MIRAFRRWKAKRRFERLVREKDLLPISYDDYLSIGNVILCDGCGTPGGFGTGGRIVSCSHCRPPAE